MCLRIRHDHALARSGRRDRRSISPVPHRLCAGDLRRIAPDGHRDRHCEHSVIDDDANRQVDALAEPNPTSPAASAAAARVLRTADSYVGVKYVWGGNTPSEGFDCSGFTKYVFAKHGITLPRTAREQVRSGTAVAADFRALRPGDIMLFAEPGQAISHVAIYAGDGQIIHASSSGGGVGYTDLNTGGEWFVAYFVAARRLL
jgi:cell wall-associated NlpC family hydrolase